VRNKALLLLALLACYGALLGPFTAYLAKRPVAVKLGFIPGPQVLKGVAADHRGDLAALLVLKTLLYFGTLSEPSPNGPEIPPDYLGMYNMLTTAVQLDPYNMDAYYFAQSFLVWDLKRVKEADAMLDYGMKYRTWDWYLPFFAGFNNAYFLKDYAKAAGYFKRVSELTGSQLSTSLTGRYLFQSGQTDLAIAYLGAMEKSATNVAVKRSFGVRLDAFKKARRIEMARDRFREARGRLPASVQELVGAGYLDAVPADPYGGTFYLNQEGRVLTTSDFATGWRERAAAQKKRDGHK
jgi:hypothetical protein